MCISKLHCFFFFSRRDNLFTLFNKRKALPKGGRYSLKEKNLLLKSILFLLRLDCYKKKKSRENKNEVLEIDSRSRRNSFKLCKQSRFKNLHSRVVRMLLLLLIVVKQT